MGDQFDGRVWREHHESREGHSPFAYSVICGAKVEDSRIFSRRKDNAATRINPHTLFF